MSIPRLCFRYLARGLLALAAACSLGAVAAAAEVNSSCPPQATPPTRELVMQARQQAADRGFLWRISRDGRDSFLYGSLHAGRPEWFAPGPQTAAALFRTGVLALEIDVTDPSVQTALSKATTGPARPLPAALAAELRAAWAAECLSAAELSSGAPELHVVQLALAQAQRQGLFALYGAESVLLMTSMAAQRPVTGLEDVHTQLQALLARTDAEAVELVRDALAEWRRPGAAASLERLTQAWATGDLKDLADYPAWCNCLGTPVAREAYDRLVTGRNPGLTDALERLHAKVSVFAAIGALHMVGPQGLPDLLRSRGFTVTRVF